ncbi:MAG: hypothetical protein M3Z32_12545 [Acidobacteriota bacterium]|nr:hypothetical protein [Acidobacteriota bacterium]
MAVISCAIAVARPPLTTVQDVLYKADGTKFEGIATISWQSFEAVDSTTIPAQTITVTIESGFMRVQLVPTTNAITPSSYTVVYNGDGNEQFAESWIIPPSNVPVRIREVRVGGPGTVLGGGPPPGALTTVQIGDVVGLTAALNIRPPIGLGFAPSRAAVVNAAGAIDGALGNLSDCVHVDGSSAPCAAGPATDGATGFVDAEIPAGTMDGTNPAFVLASPPNPPESLDLSRNGLRMRQGVDYTLSNATITFFSPSVPSTGDDLIASYRVGASLPGVAFRDAEVPSGVVDGTNLAFTLAAVPTPAASLVVYQNGLRMRLDVDYSLSGRILIFPPRFVPRPGDLLMASYRITQ